MDPKRDRQLKDLSTTLLAERQKPPRKWPRCGSSSISRGTNSMLLLGAIYLYTFMGLTMDNKPTMTP